jgi:hypothetical protein
VDPPARTAFSCAGRSSSLARLDQAKVGETDSWLLVQRFEAWRPAEQVWRGPIWAECEAAVYSPSSP